MPAQRLATVAATHPGRRDHQEDGCLAKAFGDAVVLAVADGMGGHAAGDVASRIVIEVLEKAARSGRLSSMDETAIQDAARRANSLVLAYGKEHVEASGLGSTLVAAVVQGRQALIAHAGDSKAFLVSGDELVPLTRDHSAVQDALDSGTIGEEEAKTSPYRHAILRNIGDEQFPGLDVSYVTLPEGAVLLLTSDGAHGFLTEAEILEHFAGTGDIRMGAEHLLRLAYHNGSDDNITLVAHEVGAYRRSTAPSQKPPPIDASRRSPAPTRRLWPIASLTGVLVVVLVLLAWQLSEKLPPVGLSPVKEPVPVPASPPLIEDPRAIDETDNAGSRPVWTTPVPSSSRALQSRPTRDSTAEVGERTSASAIVPTDAAPAAGTAAETAVPAAEEAPASLKPSPMSRIETSNLMDPVPISEQSLATPTPRHEDSP